jgi:asparagine synthase (glutamine-hydrolysing)
MCGFCGKYNFKDPKLVVHRLIKAMTEQMITRGPDDVGIYINKNIGLGFRRLSILDIESGHQPICNETGKIWLVANGEIYNYLELKARLTSLGHSFKTKTDTEVIVHAYEEYGTECLRMFRGMFGFAIWDDRYNRLLLARDGIGIKPLYYSENQKGLVFASELKALFKDMDVSFEIDWTGLAYYLSYNYIPEPHTIFKGIKKLLPGHYIICENERITIDKFWDIEIVEDPDAASTEMFRAKLEDAVKTQLVSDVPVGAFLSGGIDSSAICAYYCKHYPGVLHTFSVGFPQKSYNELPYAKKFASKYGTNHHEIIMGGNFADILPDIVKYFDEPFADSSMVPLYFVSKLASEHVKVVLVGDGADELFGGYDTYIANKYLMFYNKLPRPLRSIIDGTVNNLPISNSKISIEHKLKRFVRFAGQSDIFASHALWRSIFDKSALKTLMHPDVFLELSDFDISYKYKESARSDFKHSVNDYCFLDFKNYLSADMLVKVDRMTMMNSLEARLPFLDQPFVEYSFRVPSEYKIRGLKKKYLMKKALTNLLSAETVNRKKQGFNVPLFWWLKGPLKPLLTEYIQSNSNAYEFIDRNTVNKLLCDHVNGRADNSFQLWNLLIFFIWYENLFKTLRFR